MKVVFATKKVVLWCAIVLGGTNILVSRAFLVVPSRTKVTTPASTTTTTTTTPFRSSSRQPWTVLGSSYLDSLSSTNHAEQTTTHHSRTHTMIPLAEFGTPLSVVEDDLTTTTSSVLELSVDQDVVSDDMTGMTVNDIPTRDTEEASNVAVEQQEANDVVISQEAEMLFADDLEEAVVHMEDIQDNSVNVRSIYRNMYSQQKSTTSSDKSPTMEETREVVERDDPSKELQDVVSIQLNGMQPEPSVIITDEDTTKEERSDSDRNEVVGSDSVKERQEKNMELPFDKIQFDPEEVVASDTSFKDGTNQGQEVQEVSGSECQDVVGQHDTIVELQDFAKDETVEAVDVMDSASTVNTEEVEYEGTVAEMDDIMAIEIDDEVDEGVESKLDTPKIQDAETTILVSVVDSIEPEVPEVDKVVIANESDNTESQKVEVEIIASSNNDADIDANEFELVNTHLGKQQATRATPMVLKKVMKRTPFWEGSTTEDEGLVPFVFEALTPFVSLEELKEKEQQDALLYSAVNVVKAALGSGKTAFYSLGALTEVASDEEVKDWSATTMDMIRQVNQVENPLEACGKILQSAGSTVSAAVSCLMSLDSTKLAVEAASETTRSLVSAGSGMAVFLSGTVVQAKYLMKQIEAKQVEEEEMRLKEEKERDAKQQEEKQVKELEALLHKKRAEEETKLLLQLQQEGEEAKMKLELDRQIAKEAGFEKLAREMEEQRQALLHSLANGDSSSSSLDLQGANEDKKEELFFTSKH